MIIKPFHSVGAGKTRFSVLLPQQSSSRFHQFAGNSLAPKGIIHEGMDDIDCLFVNVREGHLCNNTAGFVFGKNSVSFLFQFQCKPSFFL